MYKQLILRIFYISYHSSITSQQLFKKNITVKKVSLKVFDCFIFFQQYQNIITSFTFSNSSRLTIDYLFHFSKSSLLTMYYLFHFFKIITTNHRLPLSFFKIITTNHILPLSFLENHNRQYIITSFIFTKS